MQTLSDPMALNAVDSHGVHDRPHVMRVAHISPSFGGCANAALAIHDGLRKGGVRSSLFVGRLPDSDAHARGIFLHPSSGALLRYLDRWSRRLDRRFGLAGMIHLSSLRWSFPEFNVIHLHGADSSWFNLHVLRRWARHHVLVWTMHDKHLGTGACGFPEMWDNCERWRTGCGACPKAQREGWLLDCTRVVYARKRSILARTDMAIVAPSKWMFEFLAANPMTSRHALRLIPYAVDTEVFQPLPSAQCRDEMGLPARRRLLLSVATQLGQPRKGIQYYRPLLEHLKAQCDGVDLVMAGSPPDEKTLNELRALLPVHVLGPIGEPRTLAKAYSAADVFVTMPMIDTGPRVVLESLACGTPIAAFGVGGILDVVRSDQTGVLAELGDTRGLAVAIAGLLGNDERLSRLRSSCRREAVQHYGLDTQAARYQELYWQLLRTRQQTL